ncbi:MAG: hypothetical protein J6T64_10725 [Bacteroidaceae bacterium]|nr:hypothetical protein [Bacteroidaceae bacterium]
MNARYFQLLEFTRSVTAHIRGLDNTPPPDVVHNIEWLCHQFLDPLREAVGGPVIITSGYRCRDLNTAVGGSPTSYHLLGLAADFHTLDPERRDAVIALVKEAKAAGEAWKLAPDAAPQPPMMFNQFIIYPTFFHVAVSPEGSAQKLQILRYNGFGQGYQRD